VAGLPARNSVAGGKSDRRGRSCARAWPQRAPLIGPSRAPLSPLRTNSSGVHVPLGPGGSVRAGCRYCPTVTMSQSTERRSRKPALARRRFHPSQPSARSWWSALGQYASPSPDVERTVVVGTRVAHVRGQPFDRFEVVTEHVRPGGRHLSDEFLPAPRSRGVRTSTKDALTATRLVIPSERSESRNLSRETLRLTRMAPPSWERALRVADPLTASTVTAKMPAPRSGRSSAVNRSKDDVLQPSSLTA